MKRLFIYVLLFFAIGLQASEPLRIGVISDTHYLSEQLMDDGYAMQNYVFNSGKNIAAVPEVLDMVLEEYLNSDIEILLISGDITKDGEKQSHIDFCNKLKPLREKGIRILVIPGNHDINMPKPVAFKGNKEISVPNISAKEFSEIYSDFGYKAALEKDTASLSYLAELDADTWLLTIDAARYKEYGTNSISAGRISPETEQWIVKILDKAKAKNKQVIGMMHWGLTEHIMYQDSFFKYYLVEDWVRLANLLADKGMKAIFTGHFHSNDISAFTSQKGNVIYDVETGTLSAYPFSYRYVTLDNLGMKINTKHVTSTPNNPNLAEEDRKRMLALSEKLAKGKLKGMGYNLSDSVLNDMANVLSQIFILHVYGDEKPDKGLKDAIQKLSTQLDSPIDLTDLELDFPPADNNVEIRFK